MPIFPNVQKKTPKPLRITRFRGINLSEDPTQLAENESPDMLNMLLDSEGAPDKRTGYKQVVGSLGSGPILGMFRYGNKVLIAHGTNLWAYDAEDVEV